MAKIDYESLIPDLSDIKKEEGIDPDYLIETYLLRVGRFYHALAYSTLFWPEFVIKDDCVLLGPRVPETYDSVIKEWGNNRTGLESFFNHQHIRDLFPCDYCPKSPELLLSLGRRLKEMLTAKLQQDFPNRQFHVELSEIPGDDDPEITFWQLPEIPMTPDRI